MPPAKSACLEGPVLEAHIGTLHSPAVSHLLSDTTFPQLGILRPGAPPSLYSCWPDPPPNNSSSIGPSLELAATHLTGGTMSEEDAGQKRMS